ncbi:MAG: amidase family protein [Methanobacteriota archaeon]
MARSGAFALLLAASVALSGCISPEGPGVAPAAPTGGSADCLSVVDGLDLHHVTIPELARALAEGRTTSVRLVEAYVRRIGAYDTGGPAVNSVREVSATALAQAAALDAERAAGRIRGPLHGIPILLKDNVGTVDEPTTAGSIALETNVPPVDATLTARLRESGAVILGKAELSEFANWVSLNMPNGYSSLGGQVVNAYTGGDPSGSSSGSGVAGSMALAAGTIGTETSGSILSPSDANSLVGVKPTLGLVSRRGVIPLAANFDTPGPMTRSVVDAALILGAIAGPDPEDAATAASEGNVPAGGDYASGLSADALEGVRLGYVEDDDPLFGAALADLEGAGAVLVPIEDPEPTTYASFTEFGLIPNEFKFGINRYLAEEAGPGLPVKDLTEIILFNDQHRDKVKYGQDLLIASDSTPGLGPLADASAAPVVASNRRIADDLFAADDLDALIGLHAPFTTVGAAAGYPTVIVPAGYKGRDPAGLSFFGPAWSEGRLLAYAYAYEQASMRRVPPTTVNPTLLAGVCA